MAPNNRNLLSHSSGVQKSEIKMPAGLVLSEAFESLLCSTHLASGGKKKKKVEVLATQLCPTFLTLWTVAHQAPLLMEFYKKDTGVGCHSLPQDMFQTQGSNLGLLLCRQTLYHMSYRRN